jgi:hypothetical protein|tara:strand:- start:1067 stop:1252 length:186 start_codon:yes stop_codon:yes gene_type:complete
MLHTEEQLKMNEAIDCLIALKKLELKKISLEVEIAKLTKELHTECPDLTQDEVNSILNNEA